ncbi:hypothetical protein EDD18DRAFT_669912 [Armillaria luteobubalina]|uniref:Uncharacterized protein n=1 Tax=Armillaria luteobubalina TaxID=153913 RepID=A0AA39UP02_9AGAR|nr:hypothetical protein EDD18DRAFT_669912 [Armillaria luteobubalina]
MLMRTWRRLKRRYDDSRLVACQEWNVNKYMLWYKRRRMRCVCLHYTTTSLFQSTHRTHRKHAVQYFPTSPSLLYICAKFIQSVDVRTRVRRFCTCEISYRILHRYVARGPPTKDSVGSKGNSGGTPQSSSSGSGGQTKTIQGSEGNGGGNAQNPSGGSGGQTNNSTGSTTNSG